ncbi:MAG TPA: MXAN_5187 C-terminal domain-containing protein [Vicinamibacteria bacterium]|nr:MXAN_5187 C-terminal domain-containing protein [Vicinamibacteria bacterium]
MAITDDLDSLERMVRQLQIEWEKFFGGAERKPPMELKNRVEGLIRRWAYAEIRNNTERFRYQTLSSRYNTFSELWSKRLRLMEEGRPVTGAHAPRAPLAAPPPEPEARRPAGAATAGAPPGEVRISRPEQEKEAVKALFEQYVAARQRAGEAGPVKFDSFEKVIAQQATRILDQKGGQAVDFRLETKDGKVTLKARPVK